MQWTRIFYIDHIYHIKFHTKFIHYFIQCKPSTTTSNKSCSIKVYLFYVWNLHRNIDQICHCDRQIILLCSVHNSFHSSSLFYIRFECLCFHQGTKCDFLIHRKTLCFKIISTMSLSAHLNYLLERTHCKNYAWQKFCHCLLTALALIVVCSIQIGQLGWALAAPVVMHMHS